jgi:hypothetical protein
MKRKQKIDTRKAFNRRRILCAEECFSLRLWSVERFTVAVGLVPISGERGDGTRRPKKDPAPGLIEALLVGRSGVVKIRRRRNSF